MEKCKCIGTHLFLYGNTTYKLGAINSTYYYNEIIQYYYTNSSDLHIQYEIFNEFKVFITSISKSEFHKNFITLKEERKLKLEKIRYV